MRKLTIGFISALLLFACRKEEIAIPKHDPGNVITASVNMEDDYRWQIYFDLKTNSVVGKNRKNAWDLGFETSADGFHVILNAAKFMSVYKTSETDFNSVTTVSGDQKYDAISGDIDSTAIGDWRTEKPVYIIDRGVDALGNTLDKVKFQLLNYDASSYTIQFANLDNTGFKNMTFAKDSLYNFSFLSFNNGGEIVAIEPPKKDWDLCFSQYTELLFDGNENIYYLVTGCLLNRYDTKATMTEEIGFDEINFSTTTNVPFSAAVNAIGYDWKEYDFVSYVVDVKKNYIIQDSEGLYYKLRFIDYYSEQGAKGSPKFEFQQL